MSWLKAVLSPRYVARLEAENAALRQKSEWCSRRYLLAQERCNDIRMENGRLLARLNKRYLGDE